MNIEARVAVQAAEVRSLGDGLDVLIVDDDSDTADVIGMLLAVSGHRVRTAYRASDAITLAEARLPEVAIIDLCMPEMSGFDLARCLREKSSDRPLHLIALSGRNDRAAALSASFDRFVLKPASGPMIYDVVMQTRR